jgi:ComF family protein
VVDLGREAFWDLLFPPRCVAPACRRRGAWLCRRCAAAVRPPPSPRCERCGLPGAAAARCPDCRALDPCFAAASAAGLYEPPLREAIQALKYRRAAVLAETLGALAAAALPAGAEFDVVVGVPAHPRRIRARGVDHAGLLAEVVARRRGWPRRSDLLERTRATSPQARLDPARRRANVVDAFRAAPLASGTRALLVDDVLTTGATASACAAALGRAGAASVTVCTVARAAPAGPGATGRPVSRGL